MSSFLAAMERAPKEKQRRTSLSDFHRYYICKRRREHPRESIADLRRWISEALHVEPGKTAIYETLSKSEELLRDDRPGRKDVKRHRRGAWPLVEEALVQWLTEYERSESDVTGALIQTKALSFFAALYPNEPETAFTASEGWLENFKRRHGMGESTGRRRRNQSRDLLEAEDLLPLPDTSIVYTPALPAPGVELEPSPPSSPSAYDSPSAFAFHSPSAFATAIPYVLALAAASSTAPPSPASPIAMAALPWEPLARRKKGGRGGYWAAGSDAKVGYGGTGAEALALDSQAHWDVPELVAMQEWILDRMLEADARGLRPRGVWRLGVMGNLAADLNRRFSMDVSARQLVRMVEERLREPYRVFRSLREAEERRAGSMDTDNDVALKTEEGGSAEEDEEAWAQLVRQFPELAFWNDTTCSVYDKCHSLWGRAQLLSSQAEAMDFQPNGRELPVVLCNAVPYLPSAPQSFSAWEDAPGQAGDKNAPAPGSLPPANPATAEASAACTDASVAHISAVRYLAGLTGFDPAVKHKVYVMLEDKPVRAVTLMALPEAQRHDYIKHLLRSIVHESEPLPAAGSPQKQTSAAAKPEAVLAVEQGPNGGAGGASVATQEVQENGTGSVPTAQPLHKEASVAGAQIQKATPEGSNLPMGTEPPPPENMSFQKDVVESPGPVGESLKVLSASPAPDQQGQTGRPEAIEHAQQSQEGIPGAPSEGNESRKGLAVEPVPVNGRQGEDDAAPATVDERHNQMSEAPVDDNAGPDASVPGVQNHEEKVDTPEPDSLGGMAPTEAPMVSSQDVRTWVPQPPTQIQVEALEERREAALEAPGVASEGHMETHEPAVPVEENQESIESVRQGLTDGSRKAESDAALPADAKYIEVP